MLQKRLSRKYYIVQEIVTTADILGAFILQLIKVAKKSGGLSRNRKNDMHTYSRGLTNVGVEMTEE